MIGNKKLLAKSSQETQSFSKKQEHDIGPQMYIPHVPKQDLFSIVMLCKHHVDTCKYI